jgi:recombinational DNA repair protein (RecF pathway)
LALQQESFQDETELGQAKHLLQQTLRLYLGDKPLKTREVFRAMQKG